MNYFSFHYDFIKGKEFFRLVVNNKTQIIFDVETNPGFPMSSLINDEQLIKLRDFLNLHFPT
jgi:hypothetical protein